jgi:hypothetical protein
VVLVETVSVMGDCPQCGRHGGRLSCWLTALRYREVVNSQYGLGLSAGLILGLGMSQYFEIKKSCGEEVLWSMPDEAYKLLPLYMIHPRAHYAPCFPHREC